LGVGVCGKQTKQTKTKKETQTKKQRKQGWEIPHPASLPVFFFLSEYTDCALWWIWGRKVGAKR